MGQLTTDFVENAKNGYDTMTISGIVDDMIVKQDMMTHARQYTQM